MKISILCSSKNHPINDYLKKWIAANNSLHEISLIRKKSQLEGGDFLFLISCNEIIKITDRDKFKFSLIIHASDLPKGRGWNPHIWEIINGGEFITVTLLEAEDKVDSGKVWKKQVVRISKDVLYDEINERLFNAELALMTYAIESYENITASEQLRGIEPTYYRLRNPQDSQIDPDLSISEQFNLIRVCDPNRFPAFFELNGCVYKLKIEKI